MGALGAMAQDITLPQPSKTGGKDIMESLWARHSDREYAVTPLTLQELSDIMFAAGGINRPEDGRITAPSAMNRQEIDIYAFLPEGTYKYDKAGHKLVKVADGDRRDLVADRQDFAKTAPLCVVLVGNFDTFGRNDERSVMMVSADAGIACENVALMCAGMGLSTVPRASMDHAGISALLGLPASQVPILNLPVGHPAK